MSVDHVTPGSVVGSASEHVAGVGTYVRGGVIHSSLVGVRHVAPSDVLGGLPSVSVSHPGDAVRVPTLNSVVVGKVTKVNPRFASVSILVVDGSPLAQAHRGIIRVQDIRSSDKDRVTIYKSFRPGDVVRAAVFSLGDARSYYLTTARNDLGVIFAESEIGTRHMRIGWATWIGRGYSGVIESYCCVAALLLRHWKLCSSLPSLPSLCSLADAFCRDADDPHQLAGDDVPDDKSARAAKVRKALLSPFSFLYIIRMVCSRVYMSQWYINGIRTRNSR